MSKVFNIGIDFKRGEQNKVFAYISVLAEGEATIKHQWLVDDLNVACMLAWTRLNMLPERSRTAQAVGTHLGVMAAMPPFLWDFDLDNPSPLVQAFSASVLLLAKRRGRELAGRAWSRDEIMAHAVKGFSCVEDQARAMGDDYECEIEGAWQAVSDELVGGVSIEERSAESRSNTDTIFRAYCALGNTISPQASPGPVSH